MAEVALGDLEADDATWLSRVATALEERAGEGEGCLASVYVPARDIVGFTCVVGLDVPQGLDAVRVFGSTTAAPAEFVRHAYSAVDIDTTSGIGPVCERRFQEHALDWGIRDAICVNANVGPCRGAAFLIAQPRRRRLRTGERRWLGEIARLLGLALRKRSERATRRARPRTPPARPSPDAADVRLSDEAARLQGAGFQPIREMIEDGRRRLIVEPVRVDPFSVLSAREREAVLALRTCATNKEIAIRLGASCSTVGVLLHRAALKLRAATRRELIAIARSTAIER